MKTIIQNIRNRTYWRKGSAELLGFMMVLPFIVIMIYIIITTTQVAHINQALTYCAYNACRSAVVSDNKSTAEQRADQTYNLQFGTDNSSTYGYDGCSLELLGSKKWEKGAFVRCTVRYHVDALILFSDGIREQSIVMMIENGGD